MDEQLVKRAKELEKLCGVSWGIAYGLALDEKEVRVLITNDGEIVDIS